LSYWYLATPYSKYSLGTEEAFKEAARVAGKLIQAGVKLFCPITHSHPIATYSGLKLDDYDIWLPADRPFMDLAQGILVVKMPGWDQSYGVGHEIEVFRAAGKPVRYLEWPVKEVPHDIKTG